ncbi:FAD-binding oxidoreductase [Candidatus Bipolaricaulota bacterium]|nr:FAD-binding oxidoreductase [Candidatus Bipolaricaulota bacterium]
MRNSANVVVIGGGSIGCSVAYNLAKFGVEDVVLLEKDSLASGATGRCAAGVRQQWGTEENCLVAKRSIELLTTLSDELNAELDFRQSGYMLVASTPEETDQLEENMKLQNKLGIPSEKLSLREAEELVPYLNFSEVEGIFFCEEDGHLDPFKTTFAYARAAERLGVEININTGVLDIVFDDGVKGVITTEGKISTNLVVNATGPSTKYIGNSLNLAHPVEPERHQILITEPLERVLGPMIISFQHNSYIQQVPHGGFIMGYGNPNEPHYINYKHSWRFLENMAQKAVQQLPVLKDVRVVRQWAGHYGISPDGQPVLGEVPGYAGYILACGCGKGFMLAPAIGEGVAKLITGESVSIPIDKMGIERFESGDLITEPAVV